MLRGDACCVCKNDMLVFFVCTVCVLVCYRKLSFMSARLKRRLLDACSGEVTRAMAIELKLLSYYFLFDIALFIRRGKSASRKALF